MDEEEPLERLVQTVQESAKYRHVCADVIRRLGQSELGKRRAWKEAVKETKNALHQMAGAYLDSPPPYAKWLEALPTLPAADSEACKAVLRVMMQYHASTRERLPILDAFYARTLADLRPIHSVQDIACGLNPLAAPWMGLAENAQYFACDLYTDMMQFLTRFFRLSSYAMTAEARDAAANPPIVETDVALILKFLPVLEQTGKARTLDWLRRIPARYLLVSFPTRSLGGRNVHMAENYEARFREILQQAGWQAQRYAFESELCFLVETSKKINEQFA